MLVIAAASAACARRPVPAPAAVPEGPLTFARADSLADSTAGSRVAALGGAGAVTVVLTSANGCDVVTPSGRYAVDGREIHVRVSGVRRVMVCHDPAPARPRAFAATIEGLAPGSYELAVDFIGDSPTWTPLRREVRVR
ncbi:MAG TPA: hypothetical protein VF041_12985 [Gemmatimonadaceae bacterium]